MHTKLVALFALVLASALILSACAQDSPTFPGLAPGAASYSLTDSSIVLDPGVDDSLTLCVALYSRVTLEETCVPVGVQVGPTTLAYTVESTSVTPAPALRTCNGVPTDTIPSNKRFELVFGPGIGVGSAISASIGSEVQRRSVGPLWVDESHGHTENLSFGVRLC